MRECPNCGHISGPLMTHCGCTWSEQIAAARIKERRRRESGRKKVIVDYIGSRKGGAK